jgi:iron(III) transport system permease protein
MEKVCLLKSIINNRFPIILGIFCQKFSIKMQPFRKSSIRASLLPSWLSPFPNAAFLQASRWFNGWTCAVMAIAALIATPVLFILVTLFIPKQELWQHLATTVLPRYLINSLWLALGVGTGVAVLGVATAWLTTMCRFWGSRFFQWALLFPLATPAYVLAYAYTDWLDVAGPMQSGLRAAFDWELGDYWFPDIRSLGGAIALLVLVLYPYVYLLTRVAFLEQSVCTLEASRCLGCNPWRSFWTVALPLARPALVSGLALALMETLNDFGTVQFFGIETFTTGIYRTWFGMGDRTTAAQLAAVLLALILGLLILERWSRGHARYYRLSNRPLSPYRLTGIRAAIAWVVCFLPIGLAFLLPVGILLIMALKSFHDNLSDRFQQIVMNSLVLAGLAAVLAVAIALLLAYGLRLSATPPVRTATRIAAMGYAIPGSVIAVGVLIPVGWLDNSIDAWARANLGISTGLLLSGSITALIFAYLVRFLAVSFSTVEASLTKIKPNLDEAARSLGYGASSTLLKIHTPLMWGSLISAAMLVFVDVMKELPATLVMRPFNFDTLAVQVYRLASDERLAEAAAPALLLVAVGIIPVVLLSTKIVREQR